MYHEQDWVSCDKPHDMVWLKPCFIENKIDFLGQLGKR